MTTGQYSQKSSAYWLNSSTTTGKTQQGCYFSFFETYEKNNNKGLNLFSHLQCQPWSSFWFSFSLFSQVRKGHLAQNKYYVFHIYIMCVWKNKLWQWLYCFIRLQCQHLVAKRAQKPGRHGEGCFLGLRCQGNPDCWRVSEADQEVWARKRNEVRVWKWSSLVGNLNKCFLWLFFFNKWVTMKIFMT